ncbi:unnamed protein product [Ilex paraguariensis]|uniref:TAFII28-like protein domain-containing protein n=1 Tax=Ilex paraguariensis TaxID=185542 RepID=A0ABC8ST54_9AQUA
MQLLASLTGSAKISVPMTIVVSGIAKMFVGELVETGTGICSQNGHDREKGDWANKALPCFYSIAGPQGCGRLTGMFCGLTARMLCGGSLQERYVEC